MFSLFDKHALREIKCPDLFTFGIQGSAIHLFYEDEEVIDIEPIENDLSNNKELFEQLKKVAENALVVEKEFGAPQDIEGGIKGNDIYFWQSRNIVN